MNIFLGAPIDNFVASATSGNLTTATSMKPVKQDRIKNWKSKIPRRKPLSEKSFNTSVNTTSNGGRKSLGMA